MQPHSLVRHRNAHFNILIPSKKILGLATILALLLPSIHLIAQDKVVNTAGREFTGTITGVENGNVSIRSDGGAVLGVGLNQVKSVSMKEPPEIAVALAAANKGDAAVALKAIEPIARRFGGLPLPWARQATRLVADMNALLGNNKATETAYMNYEKLYPGDPALVIGRARIAMSRKDLDAASALLNPVTEKALQEAAPSGPDGNLYSQAFLAQGFLYEARSDYPKALESYLTTVTIFNADPASVAAAKSKADAIRKEHGIVAP